MHWYTSSDDRVDNVPINVSANVFVGEEMDTSAGSSMERGLDMSVDVHMWTRRK